MADVALDDTTGDLAITDGSLTLTSGADAIKQHLKQRLRLVRGEYFLDTDRGVPYYETILVKRPNGNLVEGVLKSVILGTPGVIELLTFILDFDAATRKLTLSFSVRSTDGEIDFNALPVGV